LAVVEAIEAHHYYFDDICLAGESFIEMMQKLIALFNRMRAGFLLKAKKVNFFKNHLTI